MSLVLLGTGLLYFFPSQPDRAEINPASATKDPPVSTQSTAVVIQSRADLDKSTECHVQIEELTSGGRAVRAAKAMGICWAIAVFCILIPVLHFVLVPGFLLIGILMFIQQWGQKFYFVEGTIRCPSCQTELKPRAGAFDWPKREICNNCRADLTIQKKD
jgi:hypothetical protein